MQMTGDDQNREVSIIDIDLLPSGSIRSKPVVRQKECSRVLRDHFLKPNGDLIPVAVTCSICEEIVKPIVESCSRRGTGGRGSSAGKRGEVAVECRGAEEEGEEFR